MILRRSPEDGSIPIRSQPLRSGMFPVVVKAKNVRFKSKKEPDSDTLSHLIQNLNFFRRDGNFE